MRNMLSRVWRWITVADAPAALGPPTMTSDYECSFCEQQATCTVWINDKSWRTCLSHMRAPQEMLWGDP